MCLLDKKRYYFATILKEYNEKDSFSLAAERLGVDGLSAGQSLRPRNKQYANSDEGGLRQDRRSKSLPDSSKAWLFRQGRLQMPRVRKDELLRQG